MGGSLFNGSGIDTYFEGLCRRATEEVKLITNEQITGVDPDQYAADAAERYPVTLPAIRHDRIECDLPPFNPEQREIWLTFHVPFTGDPELFRHHGSSRPILYDNVAVQGQKLVINLRTTQHELAGVKATVDALLKRIEGEGLAPMGHNVKYFPAMLKSRVTELIRKRQGELARHANLIGQMSSIGFPLRRQEDSKESVIIPVKPKQIDLTPRPTPAKPQPEPELSLADYDSVLGVIRDMVKVFERSPTVFRGMEEEHLRTIILVGLNGVFKGAATGETFNGVGKTDILIRVRNANIFIAECLIWEGPDQFRKKLTDQLFRYATWRDSKLAAIVFSRRKNFSAVVTKMREVAGGLANCETAMPAGPETECRHRFHRTDDPQKKFVLTCQAFEVPV